MIINGQHKSDNRSFHSNFWYYCFSSWNTFVRSLQFAVAHIANRARTQNVRESRTVPRLLRPRAQMWDTSLLCKSSYQIEVWVSFVWDYFMLAMIQYLWILTMVACIKWTRLWWVLFVQPHSTSPILAWLSFSLVDIFLSSSKFPIHCCVRIYFISTLTS